MLSTLLAQALVAFTVELDNAFEERMPNVTTVGGRDNAGPGIAEWGYAPWLTSFVMWDNFLRWVDAQGTPAAEVQRRARIPPPALQNAIAGMGRWGYARTAPDPADPRPKPPRKDWLIRPTRAGRRAHDLWAPLPAEIEARWRDRFGGAAIVALRQPLAAIVSRQDVRHPAFFPIVWHAMRMLTPSLPGADETPADTLPLSSLLSKTLLAFTLDYEAASALSLAHGANLLRLLDDEDGVSYRDLPQLAGISKEALAMAAGYLQRRGLVEVGTVARHKRVRPTVLGHGDRQAHLDRLAAVEADWRVRHGPAVDALHAALAPIVGGPELAMSPLAAGLEPPPTGWRARVPRPQTLPHHPMLLHRGGYPDGA